MGSLLVVVFSYNRKQMLLDLLHELNGHYDTIVIDDGSKYSDKSQSIISMYSTLITTIHEGKQGFWKKWLLARQIALGTNHEYFMFLPDDVSNVDIKAVNKIISQGWDDRLFAMNLCNTGDLYRWGKGREFQEDFALAGRHWKQCDYVDGCFLTNRETLQAIEIDPVPKEWFDRPDKSSGVGYQMTMKLRAINCPMMMPDRSLVHHGDHDSVMHPEHRKEVKLISR